FPHVRRMQKSLGFVDEDNSVFACDDRRNQPAEGLDPVTNLVDRQCAAVEGSCACVNALLLRRIDRRAVSKASAERTQFRRVNDEMPSERFCNRCSHTAAETVVLKKASKNRLR